MGVTESKSFVWHGGMSAEQALLGEVTLRVTTYHAPPTFQTDRDFTISDDRGNPYLRVVRKFMTLRERTVLSNAETGEPVAVLERKLRSRIGLFRRKAYRILGFAPTAPDQAAFKAFEGAPLYRVAELAAGAQAGLMTYSRCEGSEDGPEVWRAKGASESSVLEIVPLEDESQCVARVDPVAAFPKSGERTCGITVAPGIDPVQAVAVALVMAKNVPKIQDYAPPEQTAPAAQAAEAAEAEGSFFSTRRAAASA
jgi:hypothetical protein